MTDRMGSRLGAAIYQSNLGQVTHPPQASVSLSVTEDPSPGRRCWQKFPRPEVPRVPASPEPGGPAALSPAPAWARAAGGRRSSRPSGGRAAGRPGEGGGRVRPSPPPAPRGPSRGRARLRPLPRPPGGPRRRSRPLTRGGRVLGKAGPGRGPRCRPRRRPVPAARRGQGRGARERRPRGRTR